MIVMPPTKVTDANFGSSTVAESDHPVWSSANTYAAGDRVILTAGYHRVYQSMQAGNINHHPATDTSDPPYWAEVGPTNRWAMFDLSNSTATTNAGSITVVISPGRIGGVFLAGLVGDELVVTLKDAPAGNVVYTRTVDILTRDVADWFDFYFADYIQLSEVVLADLPPYTGGELTVTVTGSGDVAIGTLAVGKLMLLGATQYGAEGGIIDYSRKETDAFGVTTFVERPFSKRSSMTVEVDKNKINFVARTLQDLRATPAVYLGGTDPAHGLLNVLGFYRGYRQVLSLPNTAFLSIDLEGLA